jgi:hypothetical protein
MHSHDNASLSTLVAAGLIGIPVTMNEADEYTDEPFKGVFFFQSTPSYKTEFIRHFSSVILDSSAAVISKTSRHFSQSQEKKN